MFEADDEREVLMWETSVDVTKVIIEAGLTPAEGLAVLSRTLAIGCKGGGLTRHKAITHFTEVVTRVYDALDKTIGSN